jgi:anhydro-N-acetylmuramic acid kinase
MTPLGSTARPWPDDVRRRLLGLLPPAATTVEEICQVDALVGELSGRLCTEAIARFAGGRADLIASHGQTVFHWAPDGSARATLQLGQPAFIVEETGLPVVSDVRARDVAAGGQGAPLASTLDALWLATDEPGVRRGALNLGGIANVTVVGAPGEPVVAFDTGPANCLLDAEAVRISRGGLHCDVDGRLALAGSVRADLLARLLEEPYYRLPAPKSTGRELFDGGYVARVTAELPPVTDADLMATLTELTAVTVADACRAHRLSEVVVSGGGVRNPALLAALRRTLGPVPLVRSDDRGLPAQDKEALLVALLGFLTWHSLPGVVPGATGSAVPRVLGRISPGDLPLRLPEPAAPPRRLSVVRPTR